MKIFFRQMRSLLFYLSILLLIVFSPSLHALPNQPNNNFWQPNGNVYALTVSPNGVTYVGGDFDYVGPLTGPAALVNPLNGLSSPSFPLIQGSIGAATSDNQGGWYIGGHFHQIGKTKFFDLAHIRPDGSLDESWRPQPYQDIQGDISVLKLVGNRLFVGGGFTFIGGKNRNYLAAFDAATGQLIDSWDAKIAKINDVWPFSEPINALEVVGDKLLVGGLFSQFGVQAKRYFAALKLENGELISNWGPKVDGPVTTIAPTSEGTIFLGGLFKKVTDSSLPNEDFPFLIALDSAGHAKSAWNSKPDAAVYALALSADQKTLFVGGEFISFGEGAGKQDRTCLASFNLNPATVGTITSWAPSVEKKPGNPTFKNQIASLLVSQDGKTLYAGGIFKKIDQQPHLHAAAFDLTQNGRLKEVPLQIGCNNSVRCVNLISQDKDHLLIGGDFFS